MNKVNYFVIHCKEHIERLPNIHNIQNILNVPITVFDGFYTKLVSVEYLKKLQYYKFHDSNMSMPVNVQTKSGEIGCYLSHHLLIKHIMDKSNKAEYSVIFEDDVTFKTQICDDIERIINNMKLKNIDWDIIFLGNIGKNHGNHIIDNIYTIDATRVCAGTHSLLINNKNASKIYGTNCKIIHAIDFQYKTNIDAGKLNGYVIFRPLCFQNREYSSNVQ
jgi:GR25 family glycosyltransferase involved in LPS biosynthesis